MDLLDIKEALQMLELLDTSHNNDIGTQEGFDELIGDLAFESDAGDVLVARLMSRALVLLMILRRAVEADTFVLTVLVDAFETRTNVQVVVFAAAPADATQVAPDANSVMIAADEIFVRLANVNVRHSAFLHDLDHGLTTSRGVQLGS